MPVLDEEEVGKAIYDFLTTRENPALFAGAGVGVKAGLPTWSQWMEHLADVAAHYDSLTGDLILKRANGGHYLSAAAVYKSCPEIPCGELYDQLVASLRSPPSSENLHGLVCLPFSAFFTTNYDRSLHNAFASVTSRSPKGVELGDPTMAKAPYFTDFYIARLHGRVEVPEEIVFTEEDYSRIKDNECYVDLVRHILTQYSCLFLGFSFADPAINHVFQMIEERLSPDFPKLHLAILPANAEQKLRNLLTSFNIRVLYYDPADEHLALWEGVNIASRKFTQTEKTEKPSASFPLDSVQRFLATSYARSKMKDELTPLRDVIVDGIILGLLAEAGEDGMPKEEVSASLKKYLSLSQRQANQIAKHRIENLSRRSRCRESKGRLRLAQGDINVLDNDIGTLVEGVINRFEVREGQAVSHLVQKRLLQKAAEQCISETLLSRSWDLGAHYAGAEEVKISNLLSTVSSSVEKQGGELIRRQREALSRACYNLFQSPSNEESKVLAELGRVAFGLQLTMNKPCATVAGKAVLPERVYLDANVIMPAIVEGHPYRPVYVDAIRRLGEATTQAGAPVTVLVSNGFLNEVVSHREIAQREVESMLLENPRELARHIRYYRAENTNVFVSAYGSWVGQSNEETISFDEFLERVAPYENEHELAQYLKRKGLEVVQLDFSSVEASGLYQDTFSALNEAYRFDERSRYGSKKGILIDHEARQLTRLAIDLESGIRTIFVTGDKRLRRATTGSVLGKVGQAVISRRSLVQLIDMLVGIKTDPASLTRLIWGGEISGQTTMIRNYYIETALQHYDDAMAMSLPKVLDSFVPQVTQAAEQQGITLFPNDTVESKSRTARFLDRFEADFYANMAEVIRREHPDKYAIVRNIRREHLEEHIEQTLELIKQYEAKLRESSDPKEKARYRKELAELHGYLEDYRDELGSIQQ